MSTQETVFEKPRGVANVEIRKGFAQVHISQLAQPLTEERLRITKAIAEAGVSLDFLKLTPSGLSFLVPESAAENAERALSGLGVRYSVRKDRSIVMVHAVNMRDEEGLIARVLQTAIDCGAHIDHVGDMHDRMLLVMESAQAESAYSALCDRLGVQR